MVMKSSRQVAKKYPNESRNGSIANDKSVEMPKQMYLDHFKLALA